MALHSGVRLSRYEVGSLLGAGGMGEVYQARDISLARDVALKFIADAFARDRERLARFEREAKLLASLNHPGIATIHSFEHEGDLHFLVMELVPGRTLAEILTSGPLPLDDALGYFRQIAEALEAAHEKGVIHRDLKPANLKVTPEGKVKVLDFGLAKAFEEQPTGNDDLSQSPTREGTRVGVILGTAPYMSPEQARGKRVDKLTDIWSFGCVFYEALTGRKAFSGETVTDTLAAVVKTEPDWSALPAETPLALRTLLARCLRKDLAHRLHDMADARIEIEEASAAPESKTDTRRKSLGFLPWAIAGVLALALLAALLRGERTAPAAVTRLELTLPAGVEIYTLTGPGIAISPDGRILAYVAQQGPTRTAYLRPLDDYESKPLAGMIQANGVSFSPDERFLSVYTTVTLSKVSTSDGLVIPLAQSALIRGVSWGPDDHVLYATEDGLFRVSALGGAPETLTKLDAAKGETYRWPFVLPGGKAALYSVMTLEPSADSRIEAIFFDNGVRRTVVERATNPIYVPTGHLLFARDGKILAAPFDEEKCEITDASVVVLDDVAVGALGDAKLAVSRTGTLVYAPRTLAWGHVVRVTREGEEHRLTPGPRDYSSPRIAPDGQSLAVTAEGKVWLVDLRRDTMTRLTFGPGPQQEFPVWSADGKYLFFRGGGQIARKAVDGSSSEESILADAAALYPTSVSPDGEFLAIVDIRSATGGDIVLVPLRGEEKRKVFLSTPAFEGGAQISPGEQFLAYASNESGRMEIYVQPYPDPGAKVQISTEGGNQPRWSRDAKELFYRNGDKMMAVEISTGSGFTAGAPKVLFERQYAYGVGTTLANYDVTPDGHFVMVKNEPARLNVVLNWFEELKQKVPIP